MRKFLFLYAVCLLLVFPVVANATSIPVDLSYWDDSRSTGNGIDAKDGWSGLDGDDDADFLPDNNGFKFSWDISLEDTVYTYKYTVSGVGDNYLSFGLSHLNVEVSTDSQFTMMLAEAVNRIDDDPYYQNLYKSSPPSEIPFEGPATFEPGRGSNPNMPDDIYAIKWNTDGNAGIFGNHMDIVEFVITFTSDKYPVWGDFYAKDGSHNQIVAEAWNTGFLETPTETSDFIHWIARPDTGGGGGGGGIPEPATILLLGSGLLGLAVSGKKRFKKRNG